MFTCPLVDNCGERSNHQKEYQQRTSTSRRATGREDGYIAKRRTIVESQRLRETSCVGSVILRNDSFCCRFLFLVIIDLLYISSEQKRAGEICTPDDRSVNTQDAEQKKMHY